jgi:hypothetical protein
MIVKNLLDGSYGKLSHPFNYSSYTNSETRTSL